MAFFHQFFIAMVESHKTLQALICDILFPCGDRVTSDEQEKLRQKKKVSKNRCGSGRGERARSRLGIWYRGNSMIMLLKAICHVRYVNILTWLRGFQDKLLFAVVFFVSKSLSGIQRQRKL